MSANTPPETLWRQLQPEVPIALLPVRLETRFGTRPRIVDDGGGAEGDPIDVLRVRIYPDDIGVSSRPTALTPAEQDAGRKYHADSTDPDHSRHDRDAAWEVLCQRVGVSCAVHVARADLDEPTQPDPPPAHAALLPDGWVLVGEVGDRQVFSHFVERPQGPLQVGVSSASPAFTGPGASVFPDGDGLRWLEDFGAALAM